MPQTSFPIIAITSGEPAGIGPDIIISASQDAFPARLIVLADPAVIEARANALGIDIHINICSSVDDCPVHKSGSIDILPISASAPVEAGVLDVKNAPYVLETLSEAAKGCLDDRFDAIVTPPVHKGILCESGEHFSGHTEFFQTLCNSPQVIMMLASDAMKVALVTTHLPLKDISDAITPDTIRLVARGLNKDLINRYGITKPTILVCGLNPHAGEDGHLGMEEIEIISPTLDSLRNEGINLIGPLPADTLFTEKYLKEADCVLAMYHDQGLPVLKYSGFGNAVNITLGLPIIRTSVDHGTALDLAGTGQANDGSLKVAITHAIEMANNAKKASI
ncbi:4-hydroxythreonine-4-phosphate dehydrogenase PdxA [Marinomonas mediterranea]|jgi:4-hydroxythreonine-4-phosphate dehydrogenase (EC 1.1.1.262)|uniref:4-hydroxythreonine-4-phosphate dehydrogenase n=1 Tax=Marinomonas mediterranea (strain ATCC 700492 / JCM 21426 / NBRC 103028 / MMB-1) TaxID=717774 RepID=F2K4J5_MARM1|nr:4-hydroxythreonine-4-phosphate dehydrogenase PdxA [Marinomonas mediterranea]ADZ90294.1 4-hydroxythreonine-4-phosphate dehydrogenase [Marinomonas mediterranea MMB-1]WCN16484.1 4-hydroxythreonine-4-phosphate dehydrogenase PdxA [Marinomonas mediterranea MMB-1]